MFSWRLTSGPFPVVLVVLAVVGAGFLLIRRPDRRWYRIVVPAVLVGSTLAVILIAWIVNDVWQAFTDPLPIIVVVCIGVIVAAIALMCATLVRASWQRRAVAVVATLAVSAAALNGINEFYGYYPTLGDTIGVTSARQVALPSLDPTGNGKADTAGGEQADTSPGDGGSATTGIALPLSQWRPTGSIPDAGAISQVTIPGTISRFKARSAWVYLPPAYFADPRPELPVLVLIHGQFSNPKNWIVAGDVVPTMDAFAAGHHGLAPIVVMPDASGTTTGKQMCIDSDLGHVETYLSQDVPNWIRSHLQVGTDTSHWAIGGFSYGGTCALEMSVFHPETFPTFLDISGEVAPTLKTKAATLAALNGDKAAFRAMQPLGELKKANSDPALAARLRSLDGTFVVGTDDSEYSAMRTTVVKAFQASGIPNDEIDIPGGSHSWYVAATGLTRALPHLAQRMGLA